MESKDKNCWKAALADGMGPSGATAQKESPGCARSWYTSKSRSLTACAIGTRMVTERWSGAPCRCFSAPQMQVTESCEALQPMSSVRKAEMVAPRTPNKNFKTTNTHRRKAERSWVARPKETAAVMCTAGRGCLGSVASALRCATTAARNTAETATLAGQGSPRGRLQLTQPALTYCGKYSALTAPSHDNQAMNNNMVGSEQGTGWAPCCVQKARYLRTLLDTEAQEDGCN